MIRILFVDDDGERIEAMQRAMHGRRHEWGMKFVSSGAAALDGLATNARGCHRYRHAHAGHGWMASC